MLEDADSSKRLPVMLDVTGRRCVVVGGGRVAARRARSLSECGAEVVVVSPEIDEVIRDLSVEVGERPFQTSDVAGAWLVVAATDDADVNAAVAAAAKQAGALLNRADQPAEGDFTVMAKAQAGPVTVAVDTGNRSAAAAGAIRDELMETLDPDWAKLVQAAGPARQALQAQVADPAERANRMRRLTDATAMGILKDHGEAALRAHLEALVSGEA